MHRQQLRKKAQRLHSSSLTYRASGLSISYLQTPIRGSRLLNAARILALVELTRRVHQAYAQAYDKQAADWLLPQNTGNLKDLSFLIAGAKDVIANASGDCAKLLGKDALAKFDAIAGNIQFNGNVAVHVEGLGGGIQEGSLSDVPGIDAVTDVPNNQIYLNPNGRGFNTYTRGGQPFHPLQSTFDKFGITQAQYAFSVLIHEFLHTTGKFKPDSTIGLDGKIDSSKSREYQEKLLKACFSQKKSDGRP